MKKAPNIYTLAMLLSAADGTVQKGLSDGRMVPARPEGFYWIGQRLKCAWLAFTGMADVVIWPEDDTKAGGAS